MNEKPVLVAHIIYRLGVGGLENGLVNLINTIPADRYRHVVICLAGYTEFASRIERDDVEIHDLGKKPGTDIACYARLYRLLRRLRPRIVHTRNIGTLDCQFVAFAAGVRYRVHGEHGWDMADLQGARGTHVLLRRLSRLVVHRYMTVSRHMADWLHTVIGIPAAKITQIYNGIDSAKFRPTGDRSPTTGGLVIGTVSRLDPIKDHKTLLEACEIVSRRLALQLVIVGDGAMRSELESLAEEKRLPVTFTGESQDVASLLRSFDIFALPSLNEGISNTILEAMSTGLPVLASDVGGNPELVEDGANGFLFAPGDAETLAELICRYAEDPALRSRHGSEARQRAVDRFSLGAMTDSYTSMYDQGLPELGTRQELTG